MRSEADTPVEERYLTLEGKVSPASLELIKSGLLSTRLSNTEIFFAGFAYADLAFTKQFTFVFPRGRLQDGVRCDCRIVAATQQFGKAFPEIPHGWKTICIVHFPSGIPDLVRRLPVVDSWDEGKQWVCLCDEMTRERLERTI